MDINTSNKINVNLFYFSFATTRFQFVHDTHYIFSVFRCSLLYFSSPLECRLMNGLNVFSMCLSGLPHGMK